MKNRSTLWLLLSLISVCSGSCQSGIRLGETPKTYCNPMDISYRFCLDKPSRREAADPTMIVFKGIHYLFPSKSGGYYTSTDLVSWNFIATNQIPTEEYAPTVVAVGDTLYFLASSETKSTVYKSGDPLHGKWSVAVEALEKPVWDPALFLDDNGKMYLYWGCSNVNPTYGVEVDYTHGFRFVGEIQSIVRSDRQRHGWEVPGDYNTNDTKAPWIEGSWVTKVNGNYYLQYAGPGTEFKSYADGVYVSKSPLGPFTLQATNPFCTKPEGFVAGGGHGSSWLDPVGNRWQVGAVTIAKKHMFERRLALFPVFCDREGTLYANTKYGDYPTYVPKRAESNPSNYFTGWMLLSYRKPVTVSSAKDTCPAEYMTDEDIRTYWAAKSGKPGEWASMDLGASSTVYAIQTNFAEDDTQLFGRVQGICHRYVIEASEDGKTWRTVVDASGNTEDLSHPYVQLDKPLTCRYLKITNKQVPGGNFAISGLRVFGKGKGAVPGPIESFTATREPNDGRKVTLRWSPAKGATGYVISYGVSKDKRYLSYMVYGKNEIRINNLNADSPYDLSIEAFNENGITYCPLLQHIQ
jgi:hypothetical protein